MVSSKCLAMWKRSITRPTRKRDGLLAAQRVASALGGRGDLGQIGFGGGEQLDALACALLGQQRIAAHHQPLAGEVLAGEFEQVALIEQRGLERTVLGGQLRDLRRAQASSPSPCPAGLSTCSMRAEVSMPRSPTQAMCSMPKRSLSLAT